MHLIKDYYEGLILESLKQQGESILLLSGPRMGKSTLIRRINEEKKLQSKFISARTDASDDGDKANKDGVRIVSALIDSWIDRNGSDMEDSGPAQLEEYANISLLIIDDINYMYDADFDKSLSKFDVAFNEGRIIATSQMPPYQARRRQDSLIEEGSPIYRKLKSALFEDGSSYARTVLAKIWLDPWERIGFRRVTNRIERACEELLLQSKALIKPDLPITDKAVDLAKAVMSVTGGHPALLDSTLGYLGTLLSAGSDVAFIDLIQDLFSKLVLNDSSTVDLALQWASLFTDDEPFFEFLQAAADAKPGEQIELSVIWSDWFKRAGLIRPLQGDDKGLFGHERWQIVSPLVSLRARAWLELLKGHQTSRSDHSLHGEVILRDSSVPGNTSGTLVWGRVGQEIAVHLSAAEMRLMRAFQDTPNQTIAVSVIAQRLGRRDRPTDEGDAQGANLHTVRTTLGRLMNKLTHEGLGWVLINVKGEGYRFNDHNPNLM